MHLAQNIDAIALLGHAARDIIGLRRERIRPMLKPEYASLYTKESQDNVSKHLFGEDLAKQERGAKETSAIGKKIGANAHKKPVGPTRPYYSKNEFRRDRGKFSKGFYGDHYSKDRFLVKGQRKPQGKPKAKK